MRGTLAGYDPLQLRLGDEPTATNPEYMALDIRRLLGDQVQHCIGDVFGLPEPIQIQALDDSRDRLLGDHRELESE